VGPGKVFGERGRYQVHDRCSSGPRNRTGHRGGEGKKVESSAGGREREEGVGSLIIGWPTTRAKGGMHPWAKRGSGVDFVLGGVLGKKKRPPCLSKKKKKVEDGGERKLARGTMKGAGGVEMGEPPTQGGG